MFVDRTGIVRAGIPEVTYPTRRIPSLAKYPLHLWPGAMPTTPSEGGQRFDDVGPTSSCTLVQATPIPDPAPQTGRLHPSRLGEVGFQITHKMGTLAGEATFGAGTQENKGLLVGQVRLASEEPLRGRRTPRHAGDGGGR